MTRVLERTAQRLVIRLEPLFAGLTFAFTLGMAVMILVVAEGFVRWFFGGIALAFSAFVLALIRVVTLELNRDARRITVRRAGVLSATTDVFAWQDVARLTLDTKADREQPNDPPVLSYRLALQLASGKQIMLTPYYEFEQRSKQQAIRLVDEFIGQTP